MRTELASIFVVAALTGAARGDDSAAAEPLADEHAADEHPAAAGRFALSVPAEVTLVGLTYGIRPELLYRFGERGSRSRLRIAVGYLDGPEQLFVPVSFGYRAIFRQSELVRPSVGAGVEMQQRFVPDFMTVRQYGVYVEGGVEFTPHDDWSFGFTVALDVMLRGGAGAGLGPRGFVTYQL